MGRKFSIFMVFLLVFSLLSQSGVLADTKEDKPVNFKFDFGSETSPVEEGYLKVANTLIYNKEVGYGFNKEVEFRDRGEPDNLRRDFVLADGAEFMVDLPNGDYFIRIIAGDHIAFNRSSFIIEGEDHGSITSQSGEYSELTANIVVSDEQLNIKIGENGRMNALEITSMSEIPKLELSEVSLSPKTFVKLNWSADEGAKSYKIYRKQDGDQVFTHIDDSTKAEYTDETVELGSSYTYAVSLVNDQGIESAKSNEVTVEMIDHSVAIPEAPTGLELESALEDSVAFKWEPVDGAVEYHIYRSRFNQEDYPDYEVNYTKVGVTKNTSFTDDSIFTTNHYYYVVFAVNEGGISEASEVLETPITKKQLRQMEDLNRSLVAVDTENGIYVGWRMLGTDPKSVTFDLYRDGEKVNKEPITTSTNYLDEEGTIDSKYQVRVNNGNGDPVTEEVGVWSEQYLSIPLDKPEGGVSPDGVEYMYSANDASVGDVNGDGNYEIILKWDPSNSKDNSHSGYTGNVYIDAYTLEGEKLWRIDLGKNIRAGAHYTQFLVYDFDGDGKAEVVVKTADGTVDGVGNVIGDPDADYRNSNGYILDGPEYLTVFNGETGEAMETIDYYPPRGNVNDWGDNYGNRVDRFLAGVAYLDGERPSFVMARGYYTRTVLAAYNWRDGKLTEEWVFDSDEPGNEAYAGQGNHSLSVADVDGDGKDEIIYGGMVINNDGTGLYSTGFGHGDAGHVSNFNPNRPGLEIYESYEDKSSPYGFAIRDAETGEVLSGKRTGTDVGRALIADIDPRYDGAEYWASSSWDGSSGKSGLFSVEGELITKETPSSMNFAIWWDGDLLRELLDHDFNPNVDPHGVGKIEKWNWETEKLETIFVPEGTRSNNHTKGNPTLQADLFGDWREEVIWPSADSTELRIYTTTDVTEHRIYTLMHDPQYRLAIAWQNVAYNQPPHPSFFIGAGMEEPPMPNIEMVKGDREDPELDVSELESLLKEAKLIKNDGNYTKVTFTALQNAILVAEKAMNEVKTEDELNAAIAALQSAIDGLLTLDEFNTSYMLSTLETYQEDLSEKEYRSLNTHLTAVGQFEKKGAAEKVVKHLKNFKKLLEHQLENNLISQELYEILKADSDSLIQKWEGK
ncbi:FIMAH domain-containing protein [Lederbergia sp. NSJ-179]|uniref:rhamnogalacturonan lyase family protein n=1 Tax=Lederbergia sp. NSJ-179 TaxID=2931402 RepID=UPI0037C133B4